MPSTVVLAIVIIIGLYLLSWTGWKSLLGMPELTQQYFQTALTCAGYFLMAYLTHQLAQRLQREQQLSEQSRQAAHLQDMCTQGGQFFVELAGEV